MKKKVFSWLSLVAVFLSLYSCRQELLTTENPTNETKSKVEWMSKIQILQNKFLASKLESLAKTDPKTGISKIYTDHENGFTIDTERALVIEDENGKKTYTFKIDRNTNGALENLVLAEAGNGYFDAAIIKYAPELLNNKEKLTNEQVKQYITIDYLGKKSSSEIFSKIQTCYATIQQYMFVPGTTCASSDHHVYGDPSCELTGWQAATPGYWTTSYSFIMYACDDGMPGGNIGTAPIGGGGGTPEIDLTDPCEKNQIPVNNVNNILHTSTISAEVNILKQRAANDHYEYGTAIINTGTTVIAQDPYSSNDPNDPGHVGISIPPVGDYLASAHTHPDHGAAPPSAKDLYNTLSNSKDYLTFLSSFVFSSNGTIYAFVVIDRDKAIAFLNAYPFANNTTNEGRIFNQKYAVGIDFMDIYNKYMQGSLPSYSGNSQNDGMESALARILGKYNAGITLAKADSNGNLKPLQSTSFTYTIPASGGKTIIGYKAEPCP